MSNLTARYRPQTFAQVAGQDTLKAILSRAAAEDKVAPAYLFSGTRGVGKTTVARIFAKALNCRKAPSPEPCNECDLCRAVTLGNAVDVVEIDGASNRGIDDVRRLKEVVGYAPMDGRYKIFIIDEAHMLSREAFNALLKTLEEPPARVTFVMATTEPHKFPATIISRCQHYVFRRLSEADLVTHLSNILNREGVTYDPSAVALIARRGSGSVRDSMSLLGQVLALGHSDLTEESTRSVLGLAGRDAFLRMLSAIRTGDSLTLVEIVREMLGDGLDMGFFLREFTSLWRGLFLLRQNGEAAIPLLEMPEGEARALLGEAEQYSLSHIHACWQMTLDAQRRVLTSLEPATALELLFLNLALLPQLLPLEQLGALGRKGATRPGAAPPIGRSAPPRQPEAAKNAGTAPGTTTALAAPSTTVESPAASEKNMEPAHKPEAGSAEEAKDTSFEGSQSNLPDDSAQADAALAKAAKDDERPDVEKTGERSDEAIHGSPGQQAKKDAGREAVPHTSRLRGETAPESLRESLPESPAAPPGEPPEKEPLSGRGIQNDTNPEPAQDGLEPDINSAANPPEAVEEPALQESSPALPGAAQARKPRKNYDQLKKEVMEHPLLQLVMDTFDARVVSFEQVSPKKK